VVRLIAAVVPGNPDVPRRLGAPYPCVGRQPAADLNAAAALLVVPREPAMVSGRLDLLRPVEPMKLARGAACATSR
jgi:hypothetical protein